MIKSLLVFFVFISLAATCQNTDNSAAKEDNPCDPDIMCTMDFRVVNLTIINGEGKPVILDDFYTEFEDFTFKTQRDDYQMQEGLYPVVNDGDMYRLSFKGNSAVFIGIKNGKKILSHRLKVGKDCCHVVLMEGEEEIVIDLKN